MRKGWICLHRCIQEHWIWQDANRFKWWIDLLLRASSEDKKMLIDNRLVECKRGEFITSLCALAKEWGVSRDVVRHFLNLLESDGMVTRKVTTKYTQIIICNYDSYQDKPTTDPQRSHNEATTDPQQTHTINNYNNDNNNILSNESIGETSGEAPKRTQKGVKKKAFVKPTVEEVEAYCKERQNGIDANAFMDHYEGNGWKVGKGGLPMKDWQAVVRTWEKYKRYDNNNSTPTTRPENNPLANQQWRDTTRTDKWDFTSSTDFD